MMTVRGTVQRGRGIAGRLFATPTANLELASPIALAAGVYTAHVFYDGQSFPAAFYIGPEGKCEVHLFNFAKDITNATLEVTIAEPVSGYVPWKSEEQMREKIKSDLAKVRAALNLI